MGFCTSTTVLWCCRDSVNWYLIWDGFILAVTDRRRVNDVWQQSLYSQRTALHCQVLLQQGPSMPDGFYVFDPSRFSNVMFLGYLSSLLNKWPLLMRGFRDTWHDQRRKYIPFIFYDRDIYLRFHWLVAGVKPLNRRYKYTV